MKRDFARSHRIIKKSEWTQCQSLSSLDYDFCTITDVKDLHHMAPLYWPYTNRLTLSIQHASELELLLKRNVTPALEHLTVTIEHMDLMKKRSTSRARLCEQTLRQKTDGTRLRSLFIRHMAFEDLIVLLDSLSMPALERLTLIDVYGPSKSSTSDG